MTPGLGQLSSYEQALDTTSTIFGPGATTIVTGETTAVQTSPEGEAQRYSTSYEPGFKATE